jgi:hypothetical protein
MRHVRPRRGGKFGGGGQIRALSPWATLIWGSASHTHTHTHTRLFVALGHALIFLYTLTCGLGSCLLRWLCLCGVEGERRVSKGGEEEEEEEEGERL